MYDKKAPSFNIVKYRPNQTKRSTSSSSDKFALMLEVSVTLPLHVYSLDILLVISSIVLISYTGIYFFNIN